MDLQPEMRDILMRNGMQAHIVPDGAGYSLVVQGLSHHRAADARAYRLGDEHGQQESL